MIYENRVKSANKPRLKICNHRIDTTLRSVRRELLAIGFSNPAICFGVFIFAAWKNLPQTNKIEIHTESTHTHARINMSMLCYNNGKLIFSDIFGLNVNIFGESFARSFVLSAPFNHSLYFFVLALGSVLKARKTNVHGVRALNYGFVNNPDMMQRIFSLLLIEMLS